jgi:hypothetical protein
VPAAPSSPIPAVLAKLGPLHQHDTGRLRPHLRRVPDPRSRRGRWYPLVGLLLICACAVVSGARTITEIAEWGQRATTAVLEQLGIRRHLPGRRRAPSHATLTRLLAALDGDALDAAIGTYLAERDHTNAGGAGSAPRPAIAVDGKALSGSAHRQQRHRHPRPPTRTRSRCRRGRAAGRRRGRPATASSAGSRWPATGRPPSRPGGCSPPRWSNTWPNGRPTPLACDGHSTEQAGARAMLRTCGSAPRERAKGVPSRVTDRPVTE